MKQEDSPLDGSVNTEYKGETMRNGVCARAKIYDSPAGNAPCTKENNLRYREGAPEEHPVVFVYVVFLKGLEDGIQPPLQAVRKHQLPLSPRVQQRHGSLRARPRVARRGNVRQGELNGE